MTRRQHRRRAGVDCDEQGPDAESRNGRIAVFEKTKLCKFHILGSCGKGSSCRFAHDRLQLHTVPDLSFTKLCKTLIATGVCDNKDCRYAHNKEELRMMPDVSARKLLSDLEDTEVNQPPHHPQAVLQAVAPLLGPLAGGLTMPQGAVSSQAIYDTAVMQAAIMQIGKAAQAHAAEAARLQAMAANLQGVAPYFMPESAPSIGTTLPGTVGAAPCAVVLMPDGSSSGQQAQAILAGGVACAQTSALPLASSAGHVGAKTQVAASLGERSAQFPLERWRLSPGLPGLPSSVGASGGVPLLGAVVEEPVCSSEGSTAAVDGDCMRQTSGGSGSSSGSIAWVSDCGSGASSGAIKDDHQDADVARISAPSTDCTQMPGGGGTRDFGDDFSTSGITVKNTFLDFRPHEPVTALRAVKTACGRLDFMGQD